MSISDRALPTGSRAQRGVNRAKLVPVQPAVLDQQEPAVTAQRVKAANGTRQSFFSPVTHHSSDCCRACSLLGRWASSGAATDGHGQHSLIGVEMQREVIRAGGAKPKMFPFAKLSTVPVETALLVVGNIRLCQEQFALMERAKGDRTPWVRAFLQHSAGVQSSLRSSFGQRYSTNFASPLPNNLCRPERAFRINLH